MKSKNPIAPHSLMWTKVSVTKRDKDSIVIRTISNASALDMDARITCRHTMDWFACSVLGRRLYASQRFDLTDISHDSIGFHAGIATALAAGITIVVFNSDTAGSVRVTMSFGGIMRLCATHGLVDRYGIAFLCSRFDATGSLGIGKRNHDTLLIMLEKYFVKSNN